MPGTTFSRVATLKHLRTFVLLRVCCFCQRFFCFFLITLLFKGVPNGKDSACVLPASYKDFSHMVSIGGSMGIATVQQ